MSAQADNFFWLRIHSLARNKLTHPASETRALKCLSQALIYARITAMKPFALFAVAALATLPAYACLNDRDSDSLATQAAQLPQTLRVITGRFERNPPLYYQMRIERERAALANAPTKFGSYDDIGVALDKLGRDDEALQTMKAKRAVLPAFSPNDKANREAWYRTFANEGTFRAHRFLQAGAPLARLDEMKTARAQIKRAIEIKPDAHFGRERYQLMAMDWIIARKSGKTKDTLGQWIARGDKWKPFTYKETLAQTGRKRAVEGLSGLIVLGGAWQSPDVFEALAASLYASDSVTLRYLALQRAQELLDAGQPSLGGLKLEIAEQIWNSDYGTIHVNVSNYPRLDDLFSKLRVDADSWNSARQNWLTAKLQTGVHPDTDANFWSGYADTVPPSLDIKWKNNQVDRAVVMASNAKIRFATNTISLTVAALLLILLWFWIRRAQKRSAGNALNQI